MTSRGMASGVALTGGVLLAARLVVLSVVGKEVHATIDMDAVYTVSDAARFLEFCERHAIVVKRDWTFLQWNVGNGHRAGA